MVIIKGHGTVAIGKNFQDAFCSPICSKKRFTVNFSRRGQSAPSRRDGPRESNQWQSGVLAEGEPHALFSQEHMTELVERANHDSEFRQHVSETSLSTSLTLHLEETDVSWTVIFVAGEITELNRGAGGDFMISGKEEWWRAVFSNRIDPFSLPSKES